MRYLPAIILLLSIDCFSQTSDTLNGFENKIKGEEIDYFSPLHQFAKTALLTRVNGEMPISWESPVYKGNKETVSYEFLLGHSTGTSSDNRHFNVWLNEEKLFTITTPMKKKGNYIISGNGENGASYFFSSEEYDANGDVFGRLFITVPTALVKTKAVFTISGQNENSRDWLMIFMYRKGLKILVQPTNLVTFKENKRQLNVFVDNPFGDHTELKMNTAAGIFTSQLRKGYNKLDFPVYAINFSGHDSIEFIVNHTDTVFKSLSLKPVKNYVFYIIHHSHNDIGYSHLQTEVEQIQNNNIRAAIRWINSNKTSREKPTWHVESLWAVENFLRVATAEEEKQFVQAVKSGQLVLSANYANILTGLCQQEELNWMVEYAKQLEKKYGFRIRNAMITDIPGITRSGLLAYVNNNISYLSLGPNYVESLADKGDRVGGVIREQGDKAFYWKPDLKSNKKLLVWTAGKGYSFFHGIAESEKQQAWEKRISDYCNELTEKDYPYDIVQLRYTKTDNGTVDTMLDVFVEYWNKKYLAPRLHIASVDELFGEFEKKYGNQIPVATGEISPYWEDGAYSTAIEEMQTRQLVIETIAMEKFAARKGKFQTLRNQFYQLHKNIVMFHEHTWGAWSSISDPENPFTTEQWRIKKQFLDSAKWYYDQIAAKLHYQYREPSHDVAKDLPISNFTVDEAHGGLQSITVSGKNIVSTNSKYKFFEPVYAWGVNPMKFFQLEKVTIKTIEDSPDKKVVEVDGGLPSIPLYKIVYTLFKNQRRLVCHYVFNKQIEKGKESLHIAFPLSFNNPLLEYGSDNNRLQYGRDQLPGSNKEFVCVEKELTLQSEGVTASLRSPLFSLYEVGDIIDENRTNEVKVWKNKNQNTSTLFLYLLNNYWHTNYKAYQDGEFDFEIELSLRKI